MFCSRCGLLEVRLGTVVGLIVNCLQSFHLWTGITWNTDPDATNENMIGDMINTLGWKINLSKYQKIVMLEKIVKLKLDCYKAECTRHLE